MSSSKIPFITRPKGDTTDAIDATAGSEQPNISTREPNTTTEGAPTNHEPTRKSHRSKNTKKNAVSNKDLSDKQIEIVEKLGEHSVTNNELKDKQIEIVAKLNEHSLLLVQIILLAALISSAWVLYEMGYIGNKYTPTKCI
jgi:ABC-type sugar transport system ATPase subunit